MALDNISFSPVYDIHLLRGQSIDLFALLRVGSQTATDFRTAHPAVTYTFTPFFKNVSGAGTQHAGFNVTVDTQTGMLTTQLALPPTEKKNFLVKAVATLDGESRGTHIRIHIHDAVMEAWLSPPILTVPAGLSGFRFSVRIRFDDDVTAEIGEISSGPSTTNNQLFTITWHHPTAGLVDAASGFITSSAAGAAGLLPDPVEATITDAATGLSETATGQLVIADQLSANRAELVATGNCPGFSRAREVPNILFIPDGFHSEPTGFGFEDPDRDSFNRLIDRYVSKLTHGKISSPFDLLSGSINFWKVFVDSRDRGVTTRSEVYVKEKDGNPVGVPFMKPRKPVQANGTDEPNAARWVYYHLFYHVGLPVRADKNRDNASLRAEWKETTLLSAAQVDAITDDAINNWKKTAERRLPEERDTALGLLINDYTAAENDDSFEEIDFNRTKRMTRLKLDTFLAQLKDTDGNDIGQFFTMGDPWVQGKDYDNIVLISAAPRAREQNLDGYFFITIKEFPGHYRMQSGSLTDLKVAVAFDNQLQELALARRAVLTHELGHSFALEDEYGEPAPADNFEDKFINDPLVSGWKFSRYTDAASDLDWSGNVQARQDLLSPNPNNPTTAMMDASKIKWRYHRIQKCGTVAANITASGNQYTVTLRPGQASVFSAGDKVFLRRRVAYRHTLEGQDVLTVSPDSLRRREATITSVDAAANRIVIRDADNNSFTITFRAAGTAAFFTANDTVNVRRTIVNEPISSITRVAPTAANTSDTITRLISQELEVVSLPAANQVLVRTADGSALGAEFLSLATGEVMILYKPMDAPSSVKTSAYKYAEVLSKKVLDHLAAHPFAFNARKDAAHGDTITEIIDRRAEQQTSIPGSLVPSCSSQEKKIAGLYSGGDQHHGDIYHATGKCFMRTEFHNGALDAFCVVCKYTLVDMIDPGKHGRLNEKYSKKIYPS
jgi:hypothetical protein